MNKRKLSTADALKQYPIYYHRLSEFMHLHKVQGFVLANRQMFEASIGEDAGVFADYVHTLDVALIGWLVSLLDRAKGSLNVVDVWMALHPERAVDIRRRTEKFRPCFEQLKTFRDTAGFHACVVSDQVRVRDETFKAEMAAAVGEFFGLITEMLDLEQGLWAAHAELGEAVQRIRTSARSASRA